MTAARKPIVSGRIMNSSVFAALPRTQSLATIYAPRRAAIQPAVGPKSRRPVKQIVINVRIVYSCAAQWIVDVRGPIGPLVGALAGLPVRDLVVDPFRLEDYIGQFYGGEAR